MLAAEAYRNRSSYRKDDKSDRNETCFWLCLCRFRNTHLQSERFTLNVNAETIATRCNSEAADSINWHSLNEIAGGGRLAW